MMESQNWLAEYVQTGSDASFRELVSRYVDLVYSTALRVVGGDTHRAEDVAQTVFLHLARAARTLPQDVKLGGWLHRDTCFTASTLMRGERRRQSRERLAAEMNALQNNPEADYSLVAPVLDEAINELDDADRSAIVLRFFEQHDFRSVGQALGSSEDAARMRVTRALEKLEGFLKHRGVTTTATSLGVVLSANAVQAAPVGLALTISTAAALAGTAVQTSTTIAATKFIAMTTLQKTLVTVTLAVAVGTGIYQARQASTLRTQVQTLQEQQAPVVAQLQQLQRERDGASNRAAALNDELAALKSQQKQAELLRLRGQVGTLRQQLASTEAQSNSTASGFAKMMSDPAMREYIRQAMVDLVKRRYSALFQELKLKPEQIEKFVQLISDGFQQGAQRLAAAQSGAARQAEAGQGEADMMRGLQEQLISILGESGAARFKEYSQEVPARTTIDLLNVQLGANKLSEGQSASLFKLVNAEPFDLTHGIAGDVDPAFFGSQADIDNHLAKVAESNQRVIQQAAAFLNADQLAALSMVLSNGITARITQGAAISQKN